METVKQLQAGHGEWTDEMTPVSVLLIARECSPLCVSVCVSTQGGIGFYERGTHLKRSKGGRLLGHSLSLTCASWAQEMHSLTSRQGCKRWNGPWAACLACGRSILALSGQDWGRPAWRSWRPGDLLPLEGQSLQNNHHHPHITINCSLFFLAPSVGWKRNPGKWHFPASLGKGRFTVAPTISQRVLHGD